MAKRSCFCCLDEFDVLDLMCCDINDEHSLCIPCFSAQLSGQCNGNVNQFLSCSGLNCNFRYSTLHLFEIEDHEVWSRVWRYSIQVTVGRWNLKLAEYVSARSHCFSTIALHNAIIEAMIFRCPKCKTPFMTSVEGACAALTCCNLYFCGLCMHVSNTSRANHEHLRRCGSKDDLYYTAAEYEVEQIPAKKQRVLHVLNGFSEEAKQNIMNHSTTKALMSALGTINLSLKEAGLEGYVDGNLLTQFAYNLLESWITFVAESLESFAQQPFGILLILVFQLIKSAANYARVTPHGSTLSALYLGTQAARNHPCYRKPMVFLRKMQPGFNVRTCCWTVGLVTVIVLALSCKITFGFVSCMVLLPFCCAQFSPRFKTGSFWTAGLLLAAYAGFLLFAPDWYAGKDTDVYYCFMGLHPDASPTQIKQAFREKSLLYHPDKGGSQNDMATLVNIYDVLSDKTLRTAHHIAKGYPYPNFDPTRPTAETNNCQSFSENRSSSSNGDNSGPKQSTRQQRPNWGEQSNKQQAHHRNKISEYLVKFHHTKLFEEVKNYRKNGFPLSLIVFYTNSDFNEETDRAIHAINKFLHLDSEIRLGAFDCSFNRVRSSFCYKELGLDSLPSIQLFDGPSMKPFQGKINVEQLEQFLVSYLTNRKVISSQRSWNTFLNGCADDVPCIVTVSRSIDPPLSPAIVARSLNAKVIHVPMAILKKHFPTWKAQVYDQTSNKDVHVLQVVSHYVSPVYVAMAPKYAASDNYDESLNRHNTFKLTLGLELDLPLYKYCYYVLKQLTMDGVWWVTSFFA